MQITTKLVVKGTAYHDASAAFINGSLVEGAGIRLIHEPTNPYDSNAVAVHLKETGDMLGYISRKRAPKYAQLLNTNSIVHAYVHRVKATSDLHIEIRIAYTKKAERALNKNTRYWHSLSILPSESGVYCITNRQTGRQYIGSSLNVRDRALAHLIDLLDGCHANQLLQSDFDQLGADYFEVEVLHRNLLSNTLPICEREEISKRLDGGTDLYNMTLDGQGIAASTNKPAIPLSISDRSSIIYDNYELKKLARMFNINSLSFSLTELEDMNLSPEYSAGDKTRIVWYAGQPWCLHVSGGQSKLMYVFRSAIEKIIRKKLLKTAEAKGYKF